MLQALRSAEAAHPGWKLRIIDVEYESFIEHKRRGSRPIFPGAFLLHRMRRFLKGLFREEMTVNLFVYVLAK